MKDKVSEILNDVGEECENTCRDKIERAFREAIEDIVVAVAEEVMENVLVMTLGTNITSAMTAPIPILAALASVKVQLQAANAILDGVDSLFG